MNDELGSVLTGSFAGDFTALILGGGAETEANTWSGSVCEFGGGSCRCGRAIMICVGFECGKFGAVHGARVKGVDDMGNVQTEALINVLLRSPPAVL